MNYYRIRPVAPDQWVVEKKGWVFWKTFIWGAWHEYDSPKCFSTSDEAKDAMYAQITKQHMDYLEKVVKDHEIKNHLAQPTIYIND